MTVQKFPMAARDGSLKTLRLIPRTRGDASLTPVLSFNTSRGVTVSVTGVADPALVARITNAARQTLKHVVGKWSLTLAPTRARGEWRMELRGASGVHVWVFSSRADALPDGTADKLFTFLKWAAARDA